MGAVPLAAMGACQDSGKRQPIHIVFVILALKERGLEWLTAPNTCLFCPVLDLEDLKVVVKV